MTATANNNQSLYIGLIFFITTATIAGAWWFEIIGRFEPCALCLQQRVPYYTVIPLSLAALVFAATNTLPEIVKWLMFACAAIMLVGAGMGVYHGGVEWQWWQGPSGCSSTGALDASKSILPDLSKRPVPCNEAALRIFGISLAGYNALIAAALAALSYYAARKSD